MRDHTEPRLAKWPFFFADIVLLGAAYFIYSQAVLPLSFAQLALIASCVALGAVLSLVPFLLEYRTTVRLAEAGAVTTIVAQVQHIQSVAAQITGATAQWNSVQEQAEQTSLQAKQITERMAAEAKGFQQFMEQINDSEKA